MVNVPTGHLRDPVTRQRVSFDPATGQFCNQDGTVVAGFDDDNLQINWDWNRLPLSDGLRADAIDEAASWDAWARTHGASQVGEDRDRLTLADWMAMDTLQSRVARRADLQIDGTTRMLDIGGTCKDSTYFLSAGLGQLDHVEVSSTSQRVGLRRLRSLRGTTGFGADRVRFHHVPAEALPFVDDSFDIVFSRSTLHHVSRPDTFDEICRVLRPGGLLLFVERYMSDGLRSAMRWSRGVRRLERGTDMPLVCAELDYIQSRFSEFAWFPHNVVWPIKIPLQKIGVSLPLGRFDAWLSDRAWLARRMGIKAWVIARK